MWKSNSHFPGYIQIHSVIGSKYVFLYIIMDSICAEFSGGQSKLKMGSTEDSFFVKRRMIARIDGFWRGFHQLGFLQIQAQHDELMRMMKMRVAAQVPRALSRGRCSAVDLTWLISAETPTCSAWIGDGCRHSDRKQQCPRFAGAESRPGKSLGMKYARSGTTERQTSLGCVTLCGMFFLTSL